MARDNDSVVTNRSLTFCSPPSCGTRPKLPIRFRLRLGGEFAGAGGGALGAGGDFLDLPFPGKIGEHRGHGELEAAAISSGQPCSKTLVA